MMHHLNTQRNASSREAPFKGDNETNPLAKYNSLIHILKGHEEFTLDQNGIIISSNLEAVNITGYEEYEIIGKSISIFYSEEEKEKAGFDLDKALRFKQCVVTGIRLKKRGTAFWAKMKIRTLLDEQGVLVGYNVVLQDATHRALSNVRVQTLRDEYLAIFNNPFVGSFKFKINDYRIQLCNQKTLEIIGRKDSEQLCFNEFFQSPSQFEHFIHILKTNKKVEGFKFLIKDDRDTDNWAVVSARYFEGRGFAEGVLFDISEQHSQMLELQRVNTELDNFTYHASHDLRSPLTTIMGLINLMRLEPQENIYDSLKMIEERVQHLDVILKDLASVTYNNNSEVQNNEFDFASEVTSLLKDFKSNPNINVQTKIDQENPFFTDRVRMITIIRNLLTNASNSQRADSLQVEIILKIKVKVNYVIIEVCDNGVGIEWSLKDRVWDMFFRDTTRPTGTGLALYIVKSMVDKLKGKISLESANQGTTFQLMIPSNRML